MKDANMKLHLFLTKCSIDRPIKLPEKKVVKPGAELNIKTLDTKKDGCTKEIQIIKRIEGMLTIELVYIAECSGEKDHIMEEKIKRILSMEANLLVSNTIKEMHFPPFPLLLGNFSDGKNKNK